MTGTTVTDVDGPGLAFGALQEVLVTGGTISRCVTGIESRAGILQLDGGQVISGNKVGVALPTPDGSTLVVGRTACAWIIDNELVGVQGQNVTLDLSALAHAGGGQGLQVNRFDGNGQIFDICYATLPAGSDASGNYWNAPNAPRVGSFLGRCSGLPGQVPLLTAPEWPTPPADCNPAFGGGGGGDPQRPAPTATAAPNPAAATEGTTVRVSETGAWHYRLVNARGETVRTGAFTGTALALPAAGLRSGAYQVVLFRAADGARASLTLLRE